MNRAPSLWGGVLLVSGTTIGAGMLALPVLTGFAGFWPSVFLFVLYWAYMTFTALLILEVNLAIGHRVNLVTMAKETLGRFGALISWVVYLFLLYALMTAYVAGGAPLFVNLYAFSFGVSLPLWTGGLGLLALFAFFIYKGTRHVDYFNRLLMGCLVATYLLMVGFLIFDINPELLSHANWPNLLLAVSTVATSFGFHIIIPSLTTYFEGHVNSMRRAIIIGSAIPLIVYIVWEVVALGLIPLDGPVGLKVGYENGANGAELLAHTLKSGMLSMVASLFSFFAIVTSFLGVALSLTDCLADGLKVKKTRSGKLLLGALAFIPPLLLTLTDPHIFLLALEYAGAFGVVVLLGVIPILMVWKGRQRWGNNVPYKAPGGNAALVLAFVWSLLIIGIEVGNKLGWTATWIKE